MTAPDLMKELEEIVRALPASQCPIVLADLERIRLSVLLRIVAPGISRPEALLSMEEVAAELNIPVSRAYSLARGGTLGAKRIGKYLRVERSKLSEYRASLSR